VDGAITSDEAHVATSGFDIARQVDCAICGSTHVSVVGDGEARATFEFVNNGRTGKRDWLATSTVIVSCAECGITYECKP